MEISKNDEKPEKIDFILNQGLGYLKEIEDGNALIASRSVLLLGYIVSIITYLFNYVISKDITDKVIFFTYCEIIIIYIIFSLLLIKKCLMPKSLPPIYNEPKNFLEKINYCTLVEIKEAECENIQERIDKKLSDQKGRQKSLEFILISALIIPFICYFFTILYLWSFLPYLRVE